MVEVWNIKLQNLIVHKVGNKNSDEGVVLSDRIIEIKTDDGLSRIVTNFFLKPFKDLPFYTFSHVADLKMNEVFQIVENMFQEKKHFKSNSIKLAKILYDYSDHPRIKGGDFYISYFVDCIVNNETVDAIGIFKSENKETFIKVRGVENHLVVDYEDGVSINKLDKGCLIFNTHHDKGYLVCVVDNSNKNNEAQYWKDDFLKLKPFEDNHHHTQNYLDACKSFVTKQISEEFEISKADKIELLKKSVDYFKSNDHFSEKEFAQEVFGDENVIQSFSKYKETYASEREMDLSDDFQIAPLAVKKQARAFKSVLKLDKNFDIHIHGHAELIEKGFDQAVGKHFYKIYFDKEI